MSTARDEAILAVDEPGFKGALARLILHRDPNRPNHWLAAGIGWPRLGARYV
jgi:hypothetical protein